ncbi:4Fe-4S dicluster domain-containing protein [Muricomes intestini]|uniref:4Fe-4S dicluster domain-containing protein n=1 Tax=Muricomes intestini TaxID=1796634 RepID=UPI002FE32EC0
MSILSMTKTLFKSIVHGPYTENYPAKPRENYERTRGSIENDIEDCIFCGMCTRQCPTGALEIDKEEKRWSIERMQCIQCGYCVNVCPKKCLHMRNQYTAPDTEKVKDDYVARISDH